MKNDSLSASLNPITHLLQTYPREGELSHVVAIAMSKISREEVISISDSSGATSSSEIVATYDLRKRMNYFLGKNTQGIDETLKSLSTHDRRIRLSCIRMQNSLIALWIENDQTHVCGVMIFNSEGNDSLDQHNQCNT